ncbi:hypothetical protein WJX73_001447 [Symbiochloris irregularis]|uniref:Glutamine amidotransferase type-2 domain-containing protein n=1 Tax=Symbiochloris irregularis TaxID=706552 RepID=A0AAW1NMD3_9CHLO
MWGIGLLDWVWHQCGCDWLISIWCLFQAPLTIDSGWWVLELFLPLLAGRMALICSLLLHEWAHIAAAVVLGSVGIASAENLRGHISVGDWLTLAVPGDLKDLTAGTSTADGCFHCGNFGILTDTEFGSAAHMYEVLRQMAAITMNRGAQSGGAVVMAHSQYSRKGRPTKATRVRVACYKRRNLADALMAQLRRTFWVYGPSLQQPMTCLGHTRLATTSNPTRAETHPHQWTTSSIVHAGTHRSRPKHEDEGDVEAGMAHARTPHIVQVRAVGGIFLAHNGDFNFYRLFSQDRTAPEMHVWLAAVLGCPAPAMCDSAAIAGLLDLLRTQGLWAASFRLAYQQAMARDFEEALLDGDLLVEEVKRASKAENGGIFVASLQSGFCLPCPPPSPKALQAIGKLLDGAFEQFVSRASTAGVDFASNLNLARQNRLPSIELGPEGEAMVTALGGRSALPKLLNALQAALTHDALISQGAPGDTLWMQRVTDQKRWHVLLTMTVENFLRNDLAWSLQTFLRRAKGTFGMAATCELDRRTLVLAARQQPISLSIFPESRALLYASESYATMLNLRDCDPSVPKPALDPAISQRGDNGWRLGHPLVRIDLDDANGEVFELQVAEASSCQGLLLRAWSCRDQHFLSQERMVHSQRLLCLRHNLYITFHGFSRQRDQVAADLQTVPRLCMRLAAEWYHPSTFNSLTAMEFFCMLQSNMANLESSCLDLVITGMEVSLWAAQQFATDLQGVLPHLHICVISANEAIREMSSEVCDLESIPANRDLRSRVRAGYTVGLCVSQSGQTFPTLMAGRAMQRVLPGRVFLLTRSLDVQMASVVGQPLHQDAPFGRRIITTGAPWQCAEAPSSAIMAVHHCLTELLLFLASCATRMPAEECITPLSESDVQDLHSISNTFVGLSLPHLTSPDSHVHKQLHKQGRQWALHVLEAPWAWLLAAAYIIATVISGWPIFTAITAAGHHIRSVSYVAHTLDALFYAFSPMIAAYLLRLLQRRPLLARLGKRTLIIADAAHVHQVLEQFVSKLFALSYSVVSLDVHSSSAADHLVHTMLQRAGRGTLLAVGRPDGRLCSQSKVESWVLLALQQTRVMGSLGCKAETFTVGHNPYSDPASMNATVILPTYRKPFLCEALMDGISHFKQPIAPAPGEVRSRIEAATALIDRTDQHADPSQHFTASISASTGGSGMPAKRPGFRDPGAAAGDMENLLTVFPRLAKAMGGLGISSADGNSRTWAPEGFWRSISWGMARSASTELKGPSSSLASTRIAELNLLPKSMWRMLAPHRSRRGRASEDVSEAGDAVASYMACSRHGVVGRHLMDSDQGSEGAGKGGRAIRRWLASQSMLEQLVENRFSSAERMLAFQITFHAMAKRVASFWPLQFDISRSQGGSRIATTASPVALE